MTAPRAAGRLFSLFSSERAPSRAGQSLRWMRGQGLGWVWSPRAASGPRAFLYLPLPAASLPSSLPPPTPPPPPRASGPLSLENSAAEPARRRTLGSRGPAALPSLLSSFTPFLGLLLSRFNPSPFVPLLACLHFHLPLSLLSPNPSSLPLGSGTDPRVRAPTPASFPVSVPFRPWQVPPGPQHGGIVKGPWGLGVPGAPFSRVNLQGGPPGCPSLSRTP